jgi:hypothetical protein
MPTHKCEPCLKGKQTRAEIRKSTETRTDTVLGRAFSDVSGPLPTRSHAGFSYFVTFIDDLSRCVHVVGLKEKSEVERHLKAFIARAELETGLTVKVLRSDGGGEYTSTRLATYLEDKGIQHELTTPDTPQHNGVAERMNRTLLDKVRAMLADADLPESYWYAALEYASHLHNVVPTRALDDLTPEEAWSGNKPDISALRIFGSRAYVHIPDKHRSKLAAKSLLCTFIGYAKNRKAFRLVHRPTRRFLDSRDVIFDEGGTKPERVLIEYNDAPRLEPGGASTPTTVDPPSESETEIEDILTDNLPPLVPDPTTFPPTSLASSRPKRNVRAPTRDDDQRYNVSSYGSHSRPAEHASVAQTDALQDPRSYAEAMARSDGAAWEVACKDERDVFYRMGVFEVVPRPKGRKVVGSKWVFRTKRGPDGEIQKYKARVVAQGFTQVEGIDYDETFAPVAKLSSIRTFLALAAELDLEVHQMDVKSAYLNGLLEEEIYMEPPPGFDIPEGMVMKLVKAVYGTKQGGRIWYDEVRSKLEVMGYVRTSADHAVFVRVRDGTLSIIILYVDDFIMGCKYLEIINQDKESLQKYYQMTDLGELTWILGIHVTRDRSAGWIALSQEKYIEEILERFGKSDVRPISTPALPNEHLEKLTSPEMDVKSYQSAIGALMYPMLAHCWVRARTSHTPLPPWDATPRTLAMITSALLTARSDTSEPPATSSSSSNEAPPVGPSCTVLSMPIGPAMSTIASPRPVFVFMLGLEAASHAHRVPHTARSGRWVEYTQIQASCWLSLLDQARGKGSWPATPRLRVTVPTRVPNWDTIPVPV